MSTEKSEDVVDNAELSSVSKETTLSHPKKKKRRIQRICKNISKQVLELDIHNANCKELQFTVEKDGKIIDYSDIAIPSESDYDAFRSASFLRRSNEIRELLKTKQQDTYGIAVSGKEIRFCDVDQYDPVFDLIKIKKKSYHNLTKKDEYLKAHPTESCSAQRVISDIVQKDYDSLGFHCFDDYLDTRTKYFNWNQTIYYESNKEIVCGVDDCIFRCISPEDMENHRKLHSSPLAFPCLKNGCLHSCSSRLELKHHMLQHCEHIFPCLERGCNAVFTIPLEQAGHCSYHQKGFMSQQKRGLCHLCKKLVLDLHAHKRLHPEISPKCPYPGCTTVIQSKKQYKNHRLYHKLNDDIKRLQQG